MLVAAALALLAAAWSGPAQAAGPKVTWVGAGSNFTRADRPATSIRWVVIHTTEGNFWGSVGWLKNPRARASSHYVVSQKGEIVQMVRDDDIAWHAGNYTINRASIGIEHEGYASRAGSITEAEYRSSARLSAYLARRSLMPIDRKHFIGHADVPDPNNTKLKGGFSHHHDPGPHWQWERYLNMVRAYARGATPPTYVVPAPKRPAAPKPKPVAKPKASTPNRPAPLAIATSWPKSGQSVGGFVAWNAAVTGRDIQRVDFLVDGHLRHTERQPPFAFSADGVDRWDTTREANGPHVLTLRVVTKGGRIAGSSTRVIVANTLFQVASASLANGQAVNGKVRWEAMAKGGDADRVEYLVDGRLVHTERTPPYTYEWDTKKEANGAHTLVLRGVSKDGRVAMTTLGVSVENVKPVEPAKPTKPTPSPFTIVAQTLSDGQTVQGVVAWETMVEGFGVARVEFFVDGVRRWTDRDNPWLFNGDGRWDTSREQAGPHQLVVRAVHRDGRSTSTAIRVVVARAPSAPLSIGSTLSNGATLTGTTRWEAIVSGPAPERVEFAVDGRVRHIERTAPYTYDWAAGSENAGTHAVTIRVTAAGGQSAEWTGTVTVASVLPPAPEVTATTLVPGSTVKGTVHVEASVTGSPSKVEFRLDGTLLHTETTAPYEYDWRTTSVRDGAHVLLVRAVAADGRRGERSVAVTVANAVAAPPPPPPAPAPAELAVAADGLTDGATVTGSLRFKALVTGSAANVELRIDGRLRHTETSAPYDYTWDTLGETNGKHELVLRAIAADGKTAETTLALTVANADERSVSVEGIAEGDTVTGPVELQAQVTGPTPRRVELWLDGRRVAVDRGAPYAFRWDTAAAKAGEHVLAIRAVWDADRAAHVELRVTVTKP